MHNKFFKSLVGLIKTTKLDREDVPVVTEYLKNNKKFKETARDIHMKKENIKSSFWSSIDDLLKEEDNVKFIEDKSNKSLKK
jgi:hypothetical protein